MATNQEDINAESSNPSSNYEIRQVLKTCFTAEEWAQFSPNHKLKLRVLYHAYMDSPSLRERYTLKEFLLLKPTLEKRYPHITGSPITITDPDPESSLVDPVDSSETAVVLAKSADQVSESSDSSPDLEAPPSKRKTLEELWDASDEERSKEKAASLAAKTLKKNKPKGKKKVVVKSSNKKGIKKGGIQKKKQNQPTKKAKSDLKKPETKQTDDNDTKSDADKSNRRRFKPPPPPPCFYEKKSSGKKNTPWESNDSPLEDVEHGNIIDVTYSAASTSVVYRSRRGGFSQSSTTYGSKFATNYSDLSNEPSTSSGIYTRKIPPVPNMNPPPTLPSSRSLGSNPNLPASSENDYTTYMRSFGLGFYVPRDDITATEDLTLKSTGETKDVDKESGGKMHAKGNDTTLVPVTTRSSSLSKLSKIIPRERVIAESSIGAKVPSIKESSRAESSLTSSKVTRSTKTVTYKICKPSASVKDVTPHESARTKTPTLTRKTFQAEEIKEKIKQRILKLHPILPKPDSAIKTVAKTEGQVIKPLDDVTGTWQSQQNVAAPRSLVQSPSNITDKKSLELEPFTKLKAPTEKTTSSATVESLKQDPKYENKFITINYKLSKDTKTLIPVRGRSPLTRYTSAKFKLPTYTQTYSVTTEASTSRPIITSLQKSRPESIPVVDINLPQDQIYIFQKAQAETIQSLVRPIMAASTSHTASTSKAASTSQSASTSEAGSISQADSASKPVQAKDSVAKRGRKKKTLETVKKLEEPDESIMEVITVKYPLNVDQAQIEALSTAATIDPLAVIPPERTHIPIATASDLTDPKKQPKIIHKPRIIRHSASKPIKPVSRTGTLAIRPTSPQYMTLDQHSATLLKLPPLTPIKKTGAVQTTTSPSKSATTISADVQETQSETTEARSCLKDDSGDDSVVLAESVPEEMIQMSSLTENKSNESIEIKTSAYDTVSTETQKTPSSTQGDSASEAPGHGGISETKTEESKKLYVISSGVYEDVDPSPNPSSRTSPDKEVSSAEEMSNFKEITKDLKSEIFEKELEKTTDEETTFDTASTTSLTSSYDCRDLKKEGSTKLSEQVFDDIVGSASSMTVSAETTEAQGAVSRFFTDEEMLAVEKMTKTLKSEAPHTLHEETVDEERIFDQFMMKTLQSCVFSFPSDGPVDLTRKSSGDPGQTSLDISPGTSASSSTVAATAKKPGSSKTISRFYTDEEMLAAEVMTNDLKTEILHEKETIPAKQNVTGTNEPILTSSSAISISSDEPMELIVEKGSDDAVKTEILDSNTSEEALTPEQVLMETNGGISRSSSVISVCGDDEAIEENTNLAEEGSQDTGK